MATSQSEVLINGKAVDWSDISVNLLGRKVEGIKGINFKTTQAKQNNYGAGNQPISRSRGNKESSGSINLTEAEINAIKSALPPGKVIEDILPFPIVVSWKVNGVFTSYTLTHCEFTECGLDMQQGGMDASYNIPLVIGTVLKTT